MLSTGVVINGQLYHFIGSSNSQLRERKAVLYACSSPNKAWQLLQSWGDLSKIKNIAKLYKRIGLLFSGGLRTVHSKGC